MGHLAVVKYGSYIYIYKLEQNFDYTSTLIYWKWNIKEALFFFNEKSGSLFEKAALVVQSVRTFLSHAEGLAFESRPRQT